MDLLRFAALSVAKCVWGIHTPKRTTHHNHTINHLSLCYSAHVKHTIVSVTHNCTMQRTICEHALRIKHLFVMHTFWSPYRHIQRVLNTKILSKCNKKSKLSPPNSLLHFPKKKIYKRKKETKTITEKKYKKNLITKIVKVLSNLFDSSVTISVEKKN